MEKIFSFWDLMLIPSITRFYQNNYLSAVRSSFYILIPFWLAVSFFDLIGNVFLDPSGILFDKDGLNLGFWITGSSDEDFLQSDFVKYLSVCRQVVGQSYAIIAIVISVTLSSKLSEIWQSDKILTIFSSISAFTIFSVFTNAKMNEAENYFSELGFFSVFFVTFLAAKIFSLLYKQKKLLLKIPKHFPNKMAHCLSAILPVLLTQIIFVLITISLIVFKMNIEQFLLSLENSNIFQNPVFVLFYQFIVWLLWWCGIPGYGVTSFVQEIAYIPAQLSNQIGETSSIFTAGFFEAGVIHVLGLIIAILVFSQHEGWRTVSKFSLPFMLLNVQEVFIFGLPVILNPLLLLPYILAPIANCFVGYIAISWGIVPIFQTDLPWTMPLFIGATVETHSIMGGLLQIVWLIMDIFIYAPFIITANSIELEKEKKVGEKK